MEDNKMVKVTNRDSGAVGYTLHDSGVTRTFARGESKMVPLKEIQQLQWENGGDFILRNLLMVEDSKVVEDLNMKVEPEYYYTEETIKKILLEGTLDQLDDTLTFGAAHEGVIELVKKLAVDLKIPDTNKREMITKKTGFNIDNAINVNKIMDAEDEPKEVETETTKRKTAPVVTTTSTPVRKAAPAYKVVSTEK